MFLLDAIGARLLGASSCVRLKIDPTARLASPFTFTVELGQVTGRLVRIILLAFRVAALNEIGAPAYIAKIPPMLSQ